MEKLTSLRDLNAWRAAQTRGDGVALVPTMGALHAGHMALMQAARAKANTVLASLFVNPTQFGPNEDFSRYPRTLEADCAMLQANGVNAVYAPAVEDMYPRGFNTHIEVRGVSDFLCGPFRPGHFNGVATVVAKLFHQAQPTHAFFGEKDWQQLQVIKQLVRDLDMGVEIVGVPIVREADGLALSSRNRYLSAEERAKAAQIPQTLKALVDALGADEAQNRVKLEEERAALAGAGFALDYLELADASTCAPTLNINGARLFIAARLGNTRLIDNWEI